MYMRCRQKDWEFMITTKIFLKSGNEKISPTASAMRTFLKFHYEELT